MSLKTQSYPRLGRTSRMVCPSCKALIEFVDTLRNGESSVAGVCAACEAAVAISRETTENIGNPVEWKQSVRDQGHLSSTPPSLNSVFLLAVTLVRRHWLPLLMVSFLTFVLWLLLVGIPSSMTADAWLNALGFASQTGTSSGVDDLTMNHQAGTDWLIAFAGTIAVGMVGLPVTAYTFAVMLQTVLAVARYSGAGGSQSTLRFAVSRLRVSPRIVIRLMALLGLATVCLAAVFLAGIVVILICAMVLDAQTATYTGTFSVAGMLLSALFLLQWMLWPAFILIADERADLLTGLRWGMQMVWQNKRLSLILVTAYFALCTVGSLAFYVGQVVTTPLAMMPLVIGYLKLTGGEIGRL